MNDMLIDIKNKIDTYQRGELTKKQLGKWAENQYYSMLKGNYIMLEQNISIILRCRLDKNDFKLYPTNSGCDEDMTRLEHYLDCYLGERDIDVFVFYKNGECGISVGV